MSEAARRTYFHFSPAPRGEWRSKPPDSSGYYWVIRTTAGEGQAQPSIVHFDHGAQRVLPAGFEMLAPEVCVPISLDRIQAWWTGKLSPPALGAN